MSRVAKAPVTCPPNVEVTLADGKITVKGPKGSLTEKINKLVKITKNSELNHLEFAPSEDVVGAWEQSGTARALVNNMVLGVTEGFTLSLELLGVGYRVQDVKNNTMTLSLGFSHPVVYPLPEGVTAESPSNTQIVLKSINKQILGQAASEIRGFKPPEPYKGKGIRYVGEQVPRKEAKKK
jgi:large subunit ribosomal protein L6